ncbi:MAG: hypothetical protein PHU93_02645, partial [Candidatus Gracilibacteria bacterium]|nr:hypothetical protein [Candidatus Gracilibacteria bacterium]
MKNFLRISFFLAFFSASCSVFASTGYPEVSCSAFGASANSCNQCFEGGTLYQGQYVTNMFDDFTAGNQQTAIFANNPGSVRTEYVQNGFTWSESASMWTLNSNLFSSFSATRGWYIALQPNQVASAYISSAPGTGLQFISGPSSGGSRDIPSFKLTYDTTYYTKATGFVTPESHKECVFYKSNWCGDGVVDSPKEDCDLGAQNGVPGSACPINCKLTPFDLSLKKYVSGQDAQNGFPVTVTRGQVIDYTFQARNNGPSATIGRTTVSDIAFPTGVSVISVTGAGWTCTSNTSSLSCYTDTIFQSGVNLPLITVRAQVS